MNRHGTALVLALVTLLVVTLIAGTIVQSLVAAHRQSRRYADELQAAWLAEAGLARGLTRLAADGKYSGETWQAPVLANSADEPSTAAVGQVTIRLESSTAGPAEPVARTLVAEAVYPNHETRRVLVRREVTLPARTAEPSGEQP